VVNFNEQDWSLSNERRHGDLHGHAKGHGTVFEGDAFTMPVEHVDIFDAAKFALEASHPDS